MQQQRFHFDGYASLSLLIKHVFKPIAHLQPFINTYIQQRDIEILRLASPTLFFFFFFKSNFLVGFNCEDSASLLGVNETVGMT